MAKTMAQRSRASSKDVFDTSTILIRMSFESGFLGTGAGVLAITSLFASRTGSDFVGEAKPAFRWRPCTAPRTMLQIVPLAYPRSRRVFMQRATA
jgi:hypothetical protein